MKSAVYCFISLFLFISALFAQPDKPEAAPTIDPVTESISNLRAEDVMKRRHAAETLGILRDDRAIDPLIAALRDDSPFVRMAVVDSLGLLRAAKAAKKIGEMLLKERDPQIRQSAAIALGFIGDQDTSSYLIAALKDKDAGVKYAAAASLGQIRTPEAIKAISETLTDPDPGMRVSALAALDRMDAGSEVVAVRKLISDADPRARSLAVKFLGRYKDAESIPGISQLLREDGNKMVVINSAYALGRMGDPSGLGPVREILETEKEASVKIAAIEALEAIGNRDAIILIRGFLLDQDPHVKDAARFTLIRMRVPLEEPKKRPPAREAPRR